MATRGRKPRPAEDHAARGNPGKRKRKPASTKLFPVSLDTPPDNLSDRAKEVWARIVPDIVRANLIRATDRELLAIYCDTIADYWEYAERVAKDGAVYDSVSEHGTFKRTHPLAALKDRARRTAFAASARFGLTPADRMAISLASVRTPEAPALPAPSGDQTQMFPDDDTDDQGPVGYLS